MSDILPLLSLAFVSGLGTSFQPCLFPLLPTYFSYMNSYKKGKISILEGILVSFFVALGILVVFMSLALVVKLGQIGLTGIFTTHVPEFNLLMSVFLIIVGLLMISGYEFTFFYRVPGISTLILSEDPENALIASFTLGLAYTAIATPCAAPIFLSLLGQVIFLDPLSMTLLLVIYAIGCVLPFLLIGILYPSFGKEIRTNYNSLVRYVKPFSGIILLLMSFYLLNNFVLPYYNLHLLGYTFTGFNTQQISALYISIFTLGVVIIFLLIIVLYLKKKKQNQEDLPLT